VGLLELGWRNVAEARVKPTIVVPIDPSGSRVLDIGEGPIWPVVEDGRSDAFGFVEPVDRLHEGVDAPIAVNW